MNHGVIIQKKEQVKNIIHISDIHIRTGNNIQARYDEYLYVFKDLVTKLKKLETLKTA